MLHFHSTFCTSNNWVLFPEFPLLGIYWVCICNHDTRSLTACAVHTNTFHKVNHGNSLPFSLDSFLVESLDFAKSERLSGVLNQMTASVSEEAIEPS